MYIDYNNLYEEIKLYIKEHYKPGQYLFEKDLINHYMVDKKEIEEICYDLFIDYVIDNYYVLKCSNCNYINHEKYKRVCDLPIIVIQCEHCGTKYKTDDNLDILHVVREFWYRK